MRRATRSGRHSVAPRSADRAFCAALAAAFAAALWATLALHASMDAMGGTPMAGGWTLSAAWGGSCGWRPGRAFGEFVGMWAAMTATMMLPVLAPELWRYRRRIGASGAGCRRRTSKPTGGSLQAVRRRRATSSRAGRFRPLRPACANAASAG